MPLRDMVDELKYMADSYAAVFVPGGHGAMLGIPHDPNVGQLLIIIDPEIMGSKKRFFNKITSMMESILAQEGTHLPGSNRFKFREKAAKEGLNINQKILYEIEKIA